MAAIEVSGASAVCGKCGRPFANRAKNYYSNHSSINKGVGYLVICKSCVDDLFNSYMKQCGGNSRIALRQICRKLDLYWNDNVYDQVEKKNTSYTILVGYLKQIDTMTHMGKCYDDTLIEEGSLWSFANEPEEEPELPVEKRKEAVTPEMIDFWGPGLADDDYIALEKRKQQRVADLAKDKNVDPKDFDLGTMEIIKQLCNIDIEINNSRLSGAKGTNTPALVKTAVELMEKIDIRPAQKKEDIDADVENTPLGVWIYKYEMKRPLPEVDDNLKDVNGLKKYIFTWMGHLTKMLGIKGGYTKLYEEEIERIRVEMPEYDDEDDESLISDYYSMNDAGDDL